MTAPIPSAEAAEFAGHPLDNLVWHALGTHHRSFAEGDGVAVRYRPDVTPFAAVDRLDETGWRALEDLAGPGHGVVLFRDEVGPPPDGWSVLFGGFGHQMVATRQLEAPDLEVQPLDDRHIEQMLALVKLTQPGPFAPRTIELGGYVGVFDGDRLVAMAGERLQCPDFAEVSAVCTHPDARGRGLAAALTSHVGHGIQARGQTAMLHVAEGNDNAIRVYERLGFDRRRRVEFVLLQTPEPDAG
jgi:ribosomal protein S18 acetylase RimI-like enzyme